MADITEFQGEYRWLSNFFPCQIVFEGRHYPSTEHAYQAAKIPNEYRGPFQLGTAGKAKRKGQAVVLLPDWEERKVDVMRQLLQIKFAPGSSLAEKLSATGEVRLVEGNTWRDCFWGVCGGKGLNTLGKLLMEVRTVLQENKGEGA